MIHPVDQWDAVVVGAGVAGGCTAALLADRGWRVLLVEKAAWPRETVCGGCLSASAVERLREMGMGSAVCDAGRTHSVVWQSGNKTFEHAIPGGVALLRRDLDAAIVREAVHRGAEFIPGCPASLLPASSSDRFRLLKLQTSSQTMQIRAGAVIACDGINGTLLKDEPWAEWTISRNALMGVAATYACRSDDILQGRILMCMGRQGYVGLVQIDDATQHMAAALDPASCRRAGGPLPLIAEVLRSCRREMPEALHTARLHGTGRLTRRRKQLGGYRVLVAGDACGYVEPITGEGMAWASIGAIELNRIIPQSIEEWPDDLPQLWGDRHWQVIGRQQRWCRAMRATMHHPAMARAGIFMASAMPGLAQWIVRAVCQPHKKEIWNDSIGPVSVAPSPARITADDPGHRNGESAGSAAGAVT